MGTVSEKRVVRQRQAKGPAAVPDAATVDPWLPPMLEPRPPKPDWEAFIAAGTATPALALGAERRLRRDR
jgi:hypothetical protein